MSAPLLIKKLHPDAIIPAYKYKGDAGFDLHVLKDSLVPAGGAMLLATGLAVAVPDGYELQIRLRSGVALRSPLILPNAPATVDAGYRGELGIIVRNLSGEDYLIRKGERIAQGIVNRICRVEFEVVQELPPSDRGDNGYGSTGK